MPPYPTKIKMIARKLRNDATPTEVKFWARIRRKQLKGLQFYRQKPLGKYVVDFCCPTKKLIIEIDGGQHYSEEGKNQNQKRDEDLKNLGFKTLRFSSTDITKNIDAVMEKLLLEII